MKFSELSNHHEFYCRDNIRYVKFNFPEQFNGNSLTIYPLDYAGKIEIIEEDEEVYKQEIVRISRVSEDLRGKTFTRLTVLSYIYNSYWLCICSCGNPETLEILTISCL